MIPLSFREVERKLKAAGFSAVAQKGSHVKFAKRTASGVRTAIVPRHRELAVGTIRSILRQADIWSGRVARPVRVCSPRHRLAGTQAVRYGERERPEPWRAYILSKFRPLTLPVPFPSTLGSSTRLTLRGLPRSSRLRQSRSDDPLQPRSLLSHITLQLHLVRRL